MVTAECRNPNTYVLMLATLSVLVSGLAGCQAQRRVDRSLFGKDRVHRPPKTPEALGETRIDQKQFREGVSSSGLLRQLRQVQEAAMVYDLHGKCTT